MLGSTVVDLVLEARWMVEEVAAVLVERLTVSLLLILLLGQLLEPRGSGAAGEY